MGLLSGGKVGRMSTGFSLRWPLLAFLSAIGLLLLVVFVRLWAAHKYPHRPVTDMTRLRAQEDSQEDAQEEAQEKTQGETPTSTKTGSPSNTQSAIGRVKRQNRIDAYSWTVSDDLKPEKASARFHLYQTLTRWAGIALIVLGILVSFLMGRPSRIDKEANTGSQRDIVLCLDVSGSTLAYDRQIIAAYLTLVDQLQGERIGLSIFDSTSKMVFPLTDDYTVVKSQLENAFRILKKVSSADFNKMSDAEYKKIQDWLEGTKNIANTSSLIGDGLVSCALQLPQFSVNANGTPGKASAAARARAARAGSIILATDNIQSGKGVYSLDEAMRLTRSSDIAVDGLYIGPASKSGSVEATSMRRLVSNGDGVYIDMNKTTDLNTVVRAIEKTNSGLSQTSKQTDLVDSPGLWVALLMLILFIYLALARRLRR